MEEIYGYARVSSKDQNLERQMIALREFGIDDKFIFCDKESGKDFNRREYNALVGTETTAPRLRAGDLLVVYSIDRLGRDYNEIMNQWRKITKELRANIKVLDMPLLDTRGNGSNSLDATFVADLVLQILSYVAQKERENILTRQRQGLDAMPVVNGKKVSARTGRQIGRPTMPYPENWDLVYHRWKDGEITAVEACRELSLKRSTFYKMAKLYE